MKHANLSVFIPHEGCRQMCSFCNQRIISGNERPVLPSEVEALAKKSLIELEGRTENAEIAFFGGSFTAIDRMYMISLLKAADQFIGENAFSGIRISTRPDAVDKEILDILKKYHVTAIELGAQSMDDGVLEKNRRGHTAFDTEKAANLIRQEGFELGLQMMVGLYGDTLEGSLHTAKKIISLRPNTVRVYPTVVLRGTYLAELFERGAYRPPTLDETVELCARLLDLFEENEIRVIRMGLHASQDVESQMLTGVYHPAFRELCESRRCLNRLLLELDKMQIKAGKITAFVPPGELSQWIGQKRCNLHYLSQRQIVCKFRPDRNLSKHQLHIEKEV